MDMDTRMTVGALAITSLAAVKVLERYGVDYYCDGKRPLADACQEKGVSATVVTAEVETALRNGEAGEDWNRAPLHALIQHIVSTHHEFLRLELPRIARRLQTIPHPDTATESGGLRKVCAVFSSFTRELELHLQKEEAVLFPLIARYESAAVSGRRLPPLPFGTIENPIGMMEAEHSSSDKDWQLIRRQIKELSGIQIEGASDNDLAGALRDLESDLHVHMHLENNILFPRVIALEKQHVERPPV
jgi:regulator of cell morphogenesis and NO signaling